MKEGKVPKKRMTGGLGFIGKDGIHITEVRKPFLLAHRSEIEGEDKGQ